MPVPTTAAVLKTLWGKTRFNETAEGSPELALAQDGSRTRRTVKVLWGPGDGSASDGSAQKDFIGYAEIKTDAASGKKYISRRTPYFYWRCFNTAGDRWLYCVSAPIARGVGPLGAADDAVQTFEHALLDLEFRSLSWRIKEDNDVKGPAKLADGITANPWAGIPDEGSFGQVPSQRRYVTRLTKSGGKIVSLPQGAMTYVQRDTNNQTIIVREGIPIRQASAQIIYCHHLVPEEAVCNKTIQAYLNTINKTDFDIFAAQTLLFETVDIKPIVSPLGDRIADVQLTCKWLPNCTLPIKARSLDNTDQGTPRGHNYFLRRIRGVLDYYLITDNGNALDVADPGTPAYRSTDFADLFRPDQ